MSPQCPDPELQMEVLNEAHDLTALTPELALHLEGCVACQSAVERRKRMVSVWSADQVGEDALAAAAARFRARNVVGPAGLGWFDVVPFASAGVLAGYLLLAATGTISLPWKNRQAIDAMLKAVAPASTVAASSSATENDAPRFAPVFAATDDDSKWVRTRPHIQTARGVAPLVNGLHLELKRGESARVALAGGQASSVEGPCLVEFWSTPTEVGGWRVVREELAAQPSAVMETPTGANTASPLPAVRSKSGSSAEGAGTARDLAGPGDNPGSVLAWARAAAALRADDFDGADRAFDELGHSSDPATRDAARLARAQLWISRGREAAVRPVLEQLARNGATALVRQRAAEFLNRDIR